MSVNVGVVEVVVGSVKISENECGSVIVKKFINVRVVDVCVGSCVCCSYM